jgi:hypothetical protein
MMEPKERKPRYSLARVGQSVLGCLARQIPAAIKPASFDAVRVAEVEFS